MKKIGIIGGGFSGIMTAFHIIEKATIPYEIIIINNKNNLSKGVAYDSYSKKALLNVSAAKMSAFTDKPNHFLDWVMNQEEYQNQDKSLIANSFLPRYLYGEYMESIWKEAFVCAKLKNISIKIIEKSVNDLNIIKNGIELILETNDIFKIDKCIIATGNQIPRNPTIKNTDFFSSTNYFQNPWQIESVLNLDNHKPVLIIGNGLTMVDTVLGLLEKGFTNKIYTLSPNGFNILPHRHSGIAYKNNLEELLEKKSLLEIVTVVNKHIKSVRKLGISAEAVVDAIRPYTQKIWQNLSVKEKQLFMSRLRHLWGVARHRIPLQIHDKIQQLRIEGKLCVIAGKIIDIHEKNNVITVAYYNKKKSTIETLEVSRIINCTGPETNIMKLEDSFLKKCFLKGILTQDELMLGIKADTDAFTLINSKGENHSNLFTLGSNLKGELWESTAINELRLQAKLVAEKILYTP